MNNVVIKIFSDLSDTTKIESAIKQLEPKGFSPKISLSKNIVFEKDDILIFQVNDLKSKYLSRISVIKDEISNNIIFIAPENNAVLVSSIIKMGFYDIFVLPFEQFGFIARLQEIFKNNSQKFLKGNHSQKKIIYDFDSLVGESEEFIKIINLAKKVSDATISNILIRGETGTGKGLLARAIHNNSKNSSGPFVEIVCSSLPENLLESELFGHEEGAFTSAQSMKQGLFELAENGTIFLDEIGDLSLNVQRKLLRAIETKMIRRLGAVNDTPVNARIIAATNMNLEELVEQNQFRRDLYHRLNVVSLELPPLRSRGDDVFVLTQKFIAEFSEQFNKRIINIDGNVKELFSKYKWPGNIRELRNAIERAVLLSGNEILTQQDFANFTNKRLYGKPYDIHHDDFVHVLNIQLNFKNTTIFQLEKIYAKEVFGRMDNNKTQTAKLLGISRPKLDTLLK